MLFALAVPLELREGTGDEGSPVLSGRFPYGAETELAPGRREVFSPRALAPIDDVRLLFGHSYDRPLASTGSGSLTLRNGRDALHFEARIDPAVAKTTHGRDTLALARAGLAVGVSPGFIVDPSGEEIRRSGDGILRTITRAELHELSIVTRPAYREAQVQARSWSPRGAPASVLRWWFL